MSTHVPKPRLHIDFVNGGTLKNDNFFYHLLAPHYDIKLGDKPDFVFYNHAGTKHRFLNAVRIYWSPEAYRADFSECDYAITTFYPRDEREYRFPFYAFVTEGKDLVRPPNLDWERLAGEKTGFCSFLNSYVNRKTRTRVEFFHRLSRYKKVDAGGKVLNNIGYQVPPGLDSKRRWLRQYKFHIAFENCIAPGWITEKFTDPLLAHSVPIYWGTNDVIKDFNPACFINANDFPSLDALAEHVAEVDHNPALYLKYLSAPPFHHNTPNDAFRHERLLAFLHRVFTTPIEPASSRRWPRWRRWNRWMPGKRDAWEPIRFLPAATPAPAAKLGSS